MRDFTSNPHGSRETAWDAFLLLMSFRWGTTSLSLFLFYLWKCYLSYIYSSIMVHIDIDVFTLGLQARGGCRVTSLMLCF